MVRITQKTKKLSNITCESQVVNSREVSNSKICRIQTNMQHANFSYMLNAYKTVYSFYVGLVTRFQSVLKTITSSPI